MIVEFDFRSRTLQDALGDAADVTVTVEQLDGSDTVPLRNIFWAHGSDLDAFERAVERDDTVRNFTRLGTADGGRLYRAEYPESSPDVTAYRTAIELDAVVLSATSDGDGWDVRMRFPDRSALTTFVEACTEKDLDVEPRAIYNQEYDPRYNAGLTDAQREALTTAAEMGYFSIPRGASLDDLASELGVSPQAASERIRRGTERLIEAAL